MIDLILKSMIIYDKLFFFRNLDIRFRYLYKYILFIYNYIIFEYFIFGIRFSESQYPDLSISKYLKNLNNIYILFSFLNIINLGCMYIILYIYLFLAKKNIKNLIIFFLFLN